MAEKSIAEQIAKLKADLEAMEGVPSDYAFEQAKNQTRHELWELMKKQDGGKDE